MSALIDYEVTLTVLVQGSCMDDVPGLLLEALGDHDVFPVYVTPLEGDERPDEIWVDRTTGLRWHATEAEHEFVPHPQGEDSCTEDNNEDGEVCGLPLVAHPRQTKEKNA